MDCLLNSSFAAVPLAELTLFKKDPIIPIIMGIVLILLVLGRRYFREKK